MSETRRSFLKAGTALASGVAGAASSLRAEGPAEQNATQAAAPGALVQVPKMKFGNAEISRLVLGTNQFYGFSHYSQNLDYAMRQWYTTDKICEVLRHASECGINTFNYVNLGRSNQDLQKFIDEGGKMNLVCQIIGDPAPTYKQFKPLAMYNQGEQVDKAFQDGEMDTVKEWCKKVRDLGSLVGVGTHKPEVIAYVEEKGWDVDFYAGCVYNRTRSTEEWKQTLNGEIQEMQGETYLKGDPARMYKVMRQTKKPCFAFKIFAASRISDRGIEPALRTAFASIKPIDGVFVGVWPYRKDEVRENAELVAKILKRS
jgi:hypothetical protein